MEFKHSISLLFSNPQYILKIFVYLILCLIIVVGISAAVVVPVFQNAMTYADVNESIQPVIDVIKNYIDGKVGFRAIFHEIVNSFFAYADMITNHPAGIAASILIPIGIYFLYSFLTGLCHYPLSYIINNIMSSNLKMPLASSILINIKKASRYSAAKMLILFPFDVIFVFIVGGLAILSFKTSVGIFAMPILIIIAVFILSLRAYLISGWLPRLLYHPEEKIYVALKKSIPAMKRTSMGMFQGFIFVYIISFCLSAALALPTYGLILIAVPSIYYFTLRSIELIGYYKQKEYRFYTDSATVIDTTEYGYRKETQEENNEQQ